MNSVEATKVILEILNSDSKSGKCILINGPWGIGKTYSIEGLRNHNFKYTSLFGKDDIKKVEKDLILQIELKNHSKIKVNTKIRVFFQAVNKFAENYRVNLDLNSYLDNISIESLDKNDNLIICIDDIERKLEKVSIEDILGLAERITIRYNLILIGNISKLTDKKEINRFNEFKEKVIDFEIFIDKVDEELIKIILADSFKNQYELISDKSILHIINEFKENGHDYNIRILEKFVKLLKRINAEVSLMMGEEKFWLNDLFISRCYEVIAANYLNKPKNYAEIHKLIEKILYFDKYNINSLRSYFDFKREVVEDYNNLIEAYSLDSNSLSNLISKILKKIDECDLSYFTYQEDVIPINEGLQRINRETNYIEFQDIFQKLFDIACKLYKPDLDGSIAIITPRLDFSKEIHSSTEELINEIMSENLELYVDFVKKGLSKCLEIKDYTKFKKLFFDNLNLIDALDIESSKFFCEQFNILLEQLNNKFSYDLWECITKLVEVSSEDIIIDYVSKNSNMDRLTKIRIKELREIQGGKGWT